MFLVFQGRSSQDEISTLKRRPFSPTLDDANRQMTRQVKELYLHTVHVTCPRRVKEPGNQCSQAFYSVIHVRVSCHHNSRDEVGPWGTSRGLYANTIPSLGASFACWRRRVWVKMASLQSGDFVLGASTLKYKENRSGAYPIQLYTEKEDNGPVA